MKDLQKENEILRKKLELAQNWMKREILSDLKKISQNREFSKTKFEKNIFLNENIEEIVFSKILDFIGEERILYIRKDVIENIVSAENLFFTLLNNKNIDGLWVITSYQKAFDILIENEITKLFRKYFNSLNFKPKLENDLLEKNLYSVIFEGHILWFWKLFFLLDKISKNEKLGNYWKIFLEFLEKYSYIKNILLEKEFLEIYEILADSEFFWRKRHLEKITFKDILETRKYFLWDLKEKKCFFYKLLWIYDF